MLLLSSSLHATNTVISNVYCTAYLPCAAHSLDNSYCIDNGGMIAQAGLFAYQQGLTTPMEDTSCTQRYRTDQVDAVWRS
jgi:tRNA A37 threonylcarbamoyltransferase TsaD